MSLIPHLFARLAILAAISLALTGCGKTESYRYKLTLAVDTPDGIKRGSSVVEILFYAVSIPARGVMHKLRGEALYLDLGPGKRPLIALLTSQLHPKYGYQQHWSRDAGPDDRFFLALYGERLSTDVLESVSRLARIRGPYRITPSDLPDLVTFADIDKPGSVIEVDPNDLSATLGSGVTWEEITLEITDEPVTTGIKVKLPWLPAYYHGMLDGARYHDKNILANTLSTADFDQSGDLH